MLWSLWSSSQKNIINLWYVTALSIGFELTGYGSVIDARNRATFAMWTQ
jgi:hypothetical protein